MPSSKIEHLHSDLVRVSKPGRYVGGEYGTIRDKTGASLTVCIAFPDMYEIGMSNTGIRILYNICNSIEQVLCERVFAPDRDFESVLRQRKIKLYSLETYIPVSDFDILAFSIGYELAATNVLNILDLSGIPIKLENRREEHPVVIAGGPAITNPVPFGIFFDAVLIGEGEGEFRKVVNECVDRKKNRNAAGRNNRGMLLEVFKSREAWWYAEKKEKTRASVWSGFGKEPFRYTYYPVPNIKSAQDHGVIEIMRGCRQGCRFCHAGYFYRPCREKKIGDIVREAEDLIYTFGYREITLSSLSSGDYSRIWELLRTLNSRFAGEKVSFSLPSLRIESFTLNNLKELSVVRKSGLTFAVETPAEFDQKVLNKVVERERVKEILHQAKNLGWKQAKFYFMIGLPTPDHGRPEEDMIIEYISEILASVSIKLHINLGTFVPKPHTPFQWASQLDPESAFQRMIKIKKALTRKNCKVSFHHPYLSFLEGVIARGNRKIGEVIEKAYRKGARFDAWDDMFERNIWEELFKEEPELDQDTILESRSTEEELPWDGVSLGISKKYLLEEYEKSRGGQKTGACEEQCSRPCGRCAQNVSVLRHENKGPDGAAVESRSSAESESVVFGSNGERVLFSFSKEGPAVYLSHLNVMTILERSFMRSGIRTVYTQGFNPKPKIEFAQPLVLGLESRAEIASVYIRGGNSFPELQILNESLPAGIKILRAQIIGAAAYPDSGGIITGSRVSNEHLPRGGDEKKNKKKSLMALYWGASYEITSNSKNFSNLEEKLKTWQKEKGGIIKIYGDRERNVLTITARQGDRGEGNIKRIGEFCSETGDFLDFISYVKVKRTGVYAADAAGGPQDYFSLMCYP
jgi:radical SAM superfamily enzyme YgiQ (UPF0313 family)/uncharacterized protein (DUF2344 family)